MCSLLGRFGSLPKACKKASAGLLEWPHGEGLAWPAAALQRATVGKACQQHDQMNGEGWIQGSVGNWAGLRGGGGTATGAFWAFGASLPFCCAAEAAEASFPGLVLRPPCSRHKPVCGLH